MNWLSYFNDKKAIQIHVRCYEVGNLKDLIDDIESIDEIDKKVILHPEWQQDWAQLNFNLAHISWTGKNNKDQFILKEDKNANQTNTP